MSSVQCSLDIVVRSAKFIWFVVGGFVLLFLQFSSFFFPSAIFIALQVRIVVAYKSFKMTMNWTMCAYVILCCWIKHYHTATDFLKLPPAQTHILMQEKMRICVCVWLHCIRITYTWFKYFWTFNFIWRRWAVQRKEYVNNTNKTTIHCAPTHTHTHIHIKHNYKKSFWRFTKKTSRKLCLQIN